MSRPFRLSCLGSGIFSIILLQLYLTHALAEGCDTFVLRIVSDTDEVVSGVTVIVKNDASDTKQYFFSGKNGSVEFCIDSEASRQNISIQVSDRRYREVVLSLDEAVKNKSTITLRSKEAQTREVDEIVITASHNRIARKFSPIALTKLDVLTNAAARADPLLAVNSRAFSTNGNSSADLILRGSSANLSRTYFNNVPLYEVVRGSSIDPTLRDRSVFNIILIDRMEVYPSNPPIFLSNTAAGALSLFTNYTNEDQTLINASLSGGNISLTRTMEDNNSNFIQLYTGFSDLSLLLEANPSLKEIISSAESYDAGMNLHFEAGEAGILNFFTHFDKEIGVYPQSIFATSNDYHVDSTKIYNILNYEYFLDSTRIKLDIGYSATRKKQNYSQLDISTRNEYFYAGGDIAFFLLDEKLHLRTGLSHENITLSNKGAVPEFYFDYDQGQPDNIKLENDFEYFSGYAYIVHNLTENIGANIGIRYYFDDNFGDLDASPSVQISIADSDARHKLVLGAGYYENLVLPEFLVSNDMQFTGELTQYTADYSYNSPNYQFSLGVYKKNENVQSVFTPQQQLLSSEESPEVDFWGIDTSLSASITDKLTLTTSFSHVVPRIKSGDRKIKREDSIDFLFRAGAEYILNSQSQLSVDYTHRNGQYYTNIVSTEFENNALTPVFSSTPNSEQLDDFSSLDVSFSTGLEIGDYPNLVVLYTSITNLLNTKSPSSIYYNDDFTEQYFNNYAGRVFSFGLTTEF